ncbi:hypothetical protein B0J18DRAFT_223447 [Chaetomium sp. MPI-SDFR-AT-0129]|nr:hypothetical protein B0J18DRAFT_223447 [Chaetomium sp. MPI-SDFR-AT-0129]
MSLAVNPPPPPNTTTSPPTDAPSRANLTQRSSTPHGYSGAGRKRGFAGPVGRGEQEEEDKGARLDSGGGDTTATDKDKDTPGSQRPKVEHVDPALCAGTGTGTSPGAGTGATEHESQSGSSDDHQRHDDDDEHHQHQHQHQHGQQGQGDGGDDQQGADTPTPGSVDAGNSFKKRKTTRSSRGVAHLTPEQLERKRANDREAQRAIRERQRQKTEHYEREIAQLKATKPYQELQHAVRQKEAVEAELADAKRRMAAVMAMIQPILGAVDGTPSPAQPPPPPPSQPVRSQPPRINTSGSTPNSAASPVSAGPHSRWQNSLSPATTTTTTTATIAPQPSPEMGVFDQQRYDLANNLNFDSSSRLGLEFLVDSNTKIARIKDGFDGAQDSPRYRHVPMQHDWTATSCTLPGMHGGPQPVQPPPQQQHEPQTMYGHGPTANGPYLPPVTSAMPTSSSSTAPAPVLLPIPHSSSSIPTATMTTMAPITTTTMPPITTTTTTTTTTTNTNTPPPLYTLTPRNCPPTCPLDSILLDFMTERRQRATEGLPPSEIVGPRYPSVSSLLNPAISVYSHPLSKVFTDILVCFPNLSTLPERVAVLYAMFLIMRWRVSPTRENYDRLPPWAQPSRVQLEHPHPAWYDYLPFPAMREKLVAEYREGVCLFENFFVSFSSTLCLNWPYDDAVVLLASPGGEELMINPVFEQHLKRLENWTVGEAFERAWPGLARLCNLKRG